MAEGTIKRLTDRGFGFIETSPGNDIFFHMSNVDSRTYARDRESHSTKVKVPRDHARRTYALFETNNPQAAECCSYCS
jgi:CspA family cold shock protein